MKTAEQILKEQGMSDADIATMLAVPQMRAAIETPFNKLSADLETYMKRDQEWNELNENTYKPALRAAEEDAMKARREAADYREQIKIAKEYGYFGAEAEEKARQAMDEKKQRQEAANAPRGFSADDPEFKKFAGDYSRAQGDAIAVHDFISEEYRILNGGSINEYVGQDGSRGLIALRRESQKAGKPIDQYAEDKFNWAAKRSEMQARKTAEYEERLRKEGEERYALKYGSNPMTNTAMPSRNPVVPMAPKEGGKQPWEIPNLKSERLNRAFQNEAKQRVN